MEHSANLTIGLALVAPTLALLVAAWVHWRQPPNTTQVWRGVKGALCAGLFSSLAAVVLQAGSATPPGWGKLLALTPLGSVVSLLVLGLAWVIASFSERYLQGDAQGPSGQRRYAVALAGVLASVQVLLLADHWVVLIAAWAAVGAFLQNLLCFYGNRPFALLAAYKKRLADRVADALLVGAGVLAWSEVGNGSLSQMAHDVAQQAAHGAVPAGLQASAVLLVLAVLLRTAVLPVHGWITQVMEAPTPVSALLHAGVVNLGGWVLIRQAALIEAVPLARWMLVGVGVATALLAGMVTLTRVSIKVRLAWSTVAQMGFMVMECGLGLYTLAAMHLVGHSLYKAHAFLASSGAVQNTRLLQLRGKTVPAHWSVWAAPGLALAVVAGLHTVIAATHWPWWWSVVLALTWAPLLWVPESAPPGRSNAVVAGAGLGLVAGLTILATLGHMLPLGLSDHPSGPMGAGVALAMGLMYAALAALQRSPLHLSVWRRWSYAGFYVDEIFTRVSLSLWPARWTPRHADPREPWVLSRPHMATLD